MSRSERASEPGIPVPVAASSTAQSGREPVIAALPGSVAEDRPTEKRPLKALILEDEPADAELMQGELRKAGLNFTAKRVDTRADFAEALEGFAPDVVLLDHKVPGYSGAEALAHERRVHPEIPVVIVTGTIGDEAAVELLKAGARDYVLKSNLVRLPSSVQRAISVEQGIRARKAAEKTLRGSEEKFRNLVESTTDYIWEIDENGRYTYVSPAVKALIGYEPSEVIGRSPFDFMAPAEAKRVAAEFETFAAAKLPISLLENNVLRKDGVEISLETSCVPIFDGKGTFKGYRGIDRDVTSRKRATAELQASEIRYRDLFESTGEAITIFDISSGRLLSANPAAVKLFGAKDEAEFLTRKPWDLSPERQPDGRTSEEKAIDMNETISHSGPIAFEWTHRRFDGVEFPAEVLLTRVTHGERTLLYATIRDITERKRAEKALQVSEARLKSIFDAVQAGIVIIDPELHKIVDINPAAARLFGKPKEAIIGQGCQKFLCPADVGKCPITDLGQTVDNSERVLLTSAGRSIPILKTVTMISLNGKAHLVESFVDISERKAAETSLRRLNRTLKTLSAGNEALVRATSGTELLGEMCRVVVEVGGYRMAWVGVPQQDAAKSVTPVAWAGETGEYLKNARITWADEPGSEGPHGQAIRSGKPQITQNLGIGAHNGSWREAAAESGFASSLVLPLKDATGVFAILTIDSAEPGAFDGDALELLQELANDLAYGVSAQREHTTREQLEKRWRASLEATVGAIASTVEMRDIYTAGHQRRVAQLAVAIGRKLAMPDHDSQGLYLAGIIHDVGKIVVPAEILSKPGKLSKLEFQLVQAHAQSGYEIVKGVDFPWPIAEMIHQHHERLDGSGYPQGLKGDAMVPGAKILAVADVVEAMMSHRPYRAALGIDAALAEIEKGKGSLFDPGAVDACVSLFRDAGFRFE